MSPTDQLVLGKEYVTELLDAIKTQSFNLNHFRSSLSDLDGESDLDLVDSSSTYGKFLVSFVQGALKLLSENSKLAETLQTDVIEAMRLGIVYLYKISEFLNFKNPYSIQIYHQKLIPFLVKKKMYKDALSEIYKLLKRIGVSNIENASDIANSNVMQLATSPKTEKLQVSLILFSMSEVARCLICLGKVEDVITIAQLQMLLEDDAVRDSQATAKIAERFAQLLLSVKYDNVQYRVAIVTAIRLGHKYGTMSRASALSKVVEYGAKYSKARKASEGNGLAAHLMWEAPLQMYHAVWNELVISNSKHISEARECKLIDDEVLPALVMLEQICSASTALETDLIQLSSNIAQGYQSFATVVANNMGILAQGVLLTHYLSNQCVPSLIKTSSGNVEPARLLCNSLDEIDVEPSCEYDSVMELLDLVTLKFATFQNSADLPTSMVPRILRRASALLNVSTAVLSRSLPNVGTEQVFRFHNSVVRLAATVEQRFHAMMDSKCSEPVLSAYRSSIHFATKLGVEELESEIQKVESISKEIVQLIAIVIKSVLKQQTFEETEDFQLDILPQWLECSPNLSTDVIKLVNSIASSGYNFGAKLFNLGCMEEGIQYLNFACKLLEGTSGSDTKLVAKLQVLAKCYEKVDQVSKAKEVWWRVLQLACNSDGVSLPDVVEIANSAAKGWISTHSKQLLNGTVDDFKFAKIVFEDRTQLEDNDELQLKKRNVIFSVLTQGIVVFGEQVLQLSHLEAPMEVVENLLENQLACVRVGHQVFGSTWYSIDLSLELCYVRLSTHSMLNGTYKSLTSLNEAVAELETVSEVDQLDGPSELIVLTRLLWQSLCEAHQSDVRNVPLECGLDDLMDQLQVVKQSIPFQFTNFDVWKSCQRQLCWLQQWGVIIGCSSLVQSVLEVSVSIDCSMVSSIPANDDLTLTTSNQLLNLSSMWLKTGTSSLESIRACCDIADTISKLFQRDASTCWIESAEKLLSLCGIALQLNSPNACDLQVSLANQCEVLIEQSCEPNHVETSKHLVNLIAVELKVRYHELNFRTKMETSNDFVAAITVLVTEYTKLCTNLTNKKYRLGGIGATTKFCCSKWTKDLLEWRAFDGLIALLIRVAQVWLARGDPRRSLYYLKQCLKVAESTGSVTRAAGIRNEIAKLYFETEDDEKAREQLSWWNSTSNMFESCRIVESLQSMALQWSMVDQLFGAKTQNLDTLIQTLEAKQQLHGNMSPMFLKSFDTFVLVENPDWQLISEHVIESPLQSLLIYNCYVQAMTCYKLNGIADAKEHFHSILKQGLDNLNSNPISWSRSKLLVQSETSSAGTESAEKERDRLYDTSIHRYFPICESVVGKVELERMIQDRKSNKAASFTKMALLHHMSVGSAIRTEKVRLMELQNGHHSFNDAINSLTTLKTESKLVSERDVEAIAQSLYRFDGSLTQHSEFLQDCLDMVVPEDWTICSFALSVDRKSLTLVRHVANTGSPIVLSIPQPTNASFGSILETFDALLSESESMIKGVSATEAKSWDSSAKKKWWNTRQSLDKDLKDLLEKMEYSMFGTWRFLLQTPPKSRVVRNQLSVLTKDIAKQLHITDKRGLYLLSLIAQGANSIPDTKSLGDVCEELLEVTLSQKMIDFWKSSRVILKDALRGVIVSEKCHRCVSGDSSVEVGRDAVPPQESLSRSSQGSVAKMLTAQEISKLKVVELKAELTLRGLPTTGLKKVLAHRLEEYCTQQREEDVIDVETSTIVSEPCSCAEVEDQAEDDQRQPLVLILSSELMPLPWESMTVLADQPCTRLPTISFALDHALRTRFRDADSCTSKVTGRYVVDSRGDLVSTRSTFEPVFKNLPGWEGVAGTSPSVEWLEESLETSPLFVYCGHGSGEDMIKREVIAKLKCTSTVLLMGCSSGKLERKGSLFESQGMVYSFLLGGSSCVVANLWDVTDKDIDRYTISMMDASGISGETSDTFSEGLLVCAASKSRGACKLKYLVGAAPVCFGVPDKLKKSN